ncbi:hypothetical protein [Flavisolibacter ginsenosidimutans]|uniref:Uncharacterized protein n=1 Tax=Flavisolibacter ginsenosidimutans TaxID=661481 RepID=A0A5B8UF57_9BACT|nr:hypothetical protein [Flavisolibacter ginsenosidimutans]QEC54769.1 hypothetical protein FSB75_02255 [Flavisolibacter ginsenosidimutans]
MKKIAPFFFLFAFFQLFYTAAFAQDLTGIWRGYFMTEGGDQYKYEVQINQTKKAGLSGVTYSYLDTRFYGKAVFTGNYTKASNAALVQEIKTVEVKMAGGSVACIMKCRLGYSRSGKEEFLEGTYTSTYEKADPFFDVKRGGNCGGGKVFLRKVSTSDFYVEPFLRNKKLTPSPPKTETARTTPPKKPVITKPPAKTSVAKTTTPKKTEPLVKKPQNKIVAIEPEKKKTDEVTVKPKTVEPKIVPTPVTIRDRKNELTRLITVSNSEIDISLYDNGTIDNDTVSIYLDGRLILSNKRLSNVPIKYKLQLDESSPEHTLVMVAENMGDIPPNTSLMIIQDGDKRYQVSIVSTEQKNAMVRFRYEGNNKQ